MGASPNSQQENLNAIVSLLQQQLDDKNQQIYNFKKQLAVAAALEVDYLQEIEALQSNRNAEVAAVEKEIKQLEDSIARIRDKFSLELMKKSELIESLRNEVKALENDAKKLEHMESGYVKPESRSLLLKEELNVLNEKLAETQIRIDSTELQNIALEETSHGLCTELDDVKQMYANKVRELREVKNKKHSLQEDAFLVKLDLESLKSKPLDPSARGNSLFAEVEDSRIKMQQSILQLKKNYRELKQDISNKLKRMTVLRQQNTQLSSQLDAIKDVEVEYHSVLETYKSKVFALESKVEEYRKEIMKDQIFSGKDLPAYAIDFANNTIRTKCKEVEEARQALNHESMQKLKTCAEIQSANKEMRKWRRKTQQLKVKIEELENTILELQLQNGPTDNGACSSQVATNKKSCEPVLPQPQMETKSRQTFVYDRKKCAIPQNLCEANKLEVIEHKIRVVSPRPNSFSRETIMFTTDTSADYNTGSVIKVNDLNNGINVNIINNPVKKKLFDKSSTQSFSINSENILHGFSSAKHNPLNTDISKSSIELKPERQSCTDIKLQETKHSCNYSPRSSVSQNSIESSADEDGPLIQSKASPRPKKSELLLTNTPQKVSAEKAVITSDTGSTSTGSRRKPKNNDVIGGSSIAITEYCSELLEAADKRRTASVTEKEVINDSVIITEYYYETLDNSSNEENFKCVNNAGHTPAINRNQAKAHPTDLNISNSCSLMTFGENESEEPAEEKLQCHAAEQNEIASTPENTHVVKSVASSECKNPQFQTENVASCINKQSFQEEMQETESSAGISSNISGGCNNELGKLGSPLDPLHKTYNFEPLCMETKGLDLKSSNVNTFSLKEEMQATKSCIAINTAISSKCREDSDKLENMKLSLSRTNTVDPLALRIPGQKYDISSASNANTFSLQQEMQAVESKFVLNSAINSEHNTEFGKSGSMKTPLSQTDNLNIRSLRTPNQKHVLKTALSINKFSVQEKINVRKYKSTNIPVPARKK